jgi:RNA recognition motif-containing protein
VIKTGSKILLIMITSGGFSVASKLYVGNLPFTTDENALKELFQASGEVETVKIVRDSYDGRSKGFGFVEMSKDMEADKAVESLNGMEVVGRTLRVDWAKSRPKKENTPSRRPMPETQA